MPSDETGSAGDEDAAHVMGVALPCRKIARSELSGHHNASIRMHSPLAMWPTWYVLLIAYTAILGVLAIRHQSANASALHALERSTTDPRQRGELAGQRIGGWTRSFGWLVAAGLLVTGRSWAIMIVAIAYAMSARRSYGQFAQGFAEGLKSVELAAAWEYVRGRVTPGARDQAAALVYVTLTRLIPLAATLVALTSIPR